MQNWVAVSGKYGKEKQIEQHFFFPDSSVAFTP